MEHEEQDSIDSLAEDVAGKLQLSGELQEQTGRETQTRDTADYYQLKEKFVAINDLTIHTLRAAWVVLVNAVPYSFDAYIEDGSEYPDVKPFFSYVKYSSLGYVFGMAVGTIICDVVKYEWPASSKKAFGKGSGRAKPEPLALVIMATAVMDNYRDIEMHKRLFDVTVKKAEDAKIYKIFALATSRCEDLYDSLGFKATTYTPMDLENIKVREKNGEPCSFSFMEYTIPAKAAT